MEGYEALTRFNDGVRPEWWLAEAVAAGKGAELEGTMVRAALEAARNLPAQGWLALKASVRLLGADPELRFALANFGRPLVVELTEPSTSDVLPELRNLRDLLPPNALLALEHAGLGHKSLEVLLELRPAFVKLDRSEVSDLAADEARQAQLAHLVGVAGDCGCQVVVPGVESDEQRRLLGRLGATLGQGYLFGPRDAGARGRGRPGGASQFTGRPLSGA